MTTSLAQQERTAELPIVSLAASDGSAPPNIVLAFSPVGDLIATASEASGEIQLWSTGTRKPVSVLVDADSNEINDVAFEHG
jgi:WD40 repeat protein